MNLTAAELAFVRGSGLYVTEKCDGCGMLLNQTLRYTIAEKPEAYCPAACRGLAFFRDRHQARKRVAPERCAYWDGGLGGRKRGTLYCDDVCRMRHSRVCERLATRQVEKALTPSLSSQ